MFDKCPVIEENKSQFYIAALDLPERKRPGVSQLRLNRPHWMKNPDYPALFQPVGLFFKRFWRTGDDRKS